MHSYQHNIKTFNHATRHLTRVEQSLYRCLIEMYYDTEQPLQATDFDRLCRIVLAVTDEEKTAVKSVLDEFFVRTGDVYTHQYCDEVIEKYRSNSSAKSIAGKASAANRIKKASKRKDIRSTKLNTTSTDVQQTFNTCSTDVLNHKTIKQETNINTQAVAIAPVVVNLPVKRKSESSEILATVPNLPPQVAADFLQVRKAKRSPLTATALALIEREAARAGLTTAQAIAISTGRGWQSFRAEWIGRDKTYAEKTQDYKDEQAAKFYKPLLEADLETLKKWGLA